jgi:hypothetical protein
VYGRSQTSDGIYGTTWDIAHVGVKGYHGLSGLSGELGAAGFGVYGRGGVNGVGVHGSSNYNYAVSGNSIYGIGVYGTGDSIGVYGYSDDGIAVEGLAGASGAAGYFIGNVDVTGTVTKGGGSFVIDHPLDPENKLLRHNFVESPENLLIYRGKVRLDAGGEALVRLPGYFAALAGEQDATVVLTAVGRPFLTGYDWQSDFTGFTVYGDPGREISWVVYADRDDPVIHKLARPVEETKGPDSRMCERGRLIYPEAYGYPESMGRDYEKRQAAEAQARER